MAHQIFDGVLNRTADDPLSHDATFLSIRKPQDGTAMMFVTATDEEVTLLEHGDPQRWLAFEDLVGAPRRHVVEPDATLPDTEWRQGSRTDGESQTLIRAHRRLPSDPVTHLTVFGFLSRRSRRAHRRSAHLLIRSIRVETMDGQRL